MSELTTQQRAAWRWVWTELDMDEPFNVDTVTALCDRAKLHGDEIHRRWAEVVMRDVMESGE